MTVERQSALIAAIYEPISYNSMIIRITKLALRSHQAEYHWEVSLDRAVNGPF